MDQILWIIQIIGGIRINVNVSVKHINYVKNPATQSWYTSITDDEITDVEAKSYEKQTKTVSKILVKKPPGKTQS